MGEATKSRYPGPGWAPATRNVSEHRGMHTGDRIRIWMETE